MLILSICSAAVSISSGMAVLLALFRTGRRYLEGQRCLLRTVIKSTYYQYRAAKQIPEYELENFILCYEAYKALGGNSFCDILYQEVTGWDVVKQNI